MSAPQITFQPFIAASGTYDTGVSGVSLTDKGNLANDSSAGVSVSWGVTGLHSWRHTKVGLGYHGGFNRYFQKTQFNPTNQSFLLGVTHQITRHVTFNLHESAGLFGRDFGRLGLDPTIPFDPATTHTPTTDFFDNRTYYLSTQADLSFQKSARMSFNIGGDVFFNRRRSSALNGTTGVGARGDIQYRWSRRITVGVVYDFNRYTYTKTFGGSNIHSASGSFALALGPKTEFTAYAGVARAESEFLQLVPLDPVIVALLGITTGSRVVGQVLYAPNMSVRLSHTLSKGVLFVGGGHGFTPGNGLFLTSTQTSVSGGYGYTGLRRWSLNSHVSYNHASAVGPIVGGYNTMSGSVNLSRQILPKIHMTIGYSVRRYSSPTFPNYNRPIHQVQIGLAFSPGDVPLRVW